MNEIEELRNLVNQVEAKEDLLMSTGKPFRYLGWYYRDLDDSIMLSKSEGVMWIDQAGKWDYPRCFLNKKDSMKVIHLAIKCCKDLLNGSLKGRDELHTFIDSFEPEEDLK